MDNFEAILAKIAENTKMLDDKVVIAPEVIDELKSANASAVESVTAANAKIAELEASLAAVSDKCDTLEVEKTISECVAYIGKTEKEIVEAKAKADAEINRRKEELSKVGVTSEKAITAAFAVDNDGFEAMLAAFSDVAETEKKKAIENKKVDIQNGQKEMESVVAKDGGTQEMNLNEKMSFSERFRKVAKEATKVK